jgi:ribonuclease I
MRRAGRSGMATCAVRSDNRKNCTAAKAPKCRRFYMPFSTRFGNINQAQKFNNITQPKQTFQMSFILNLSWSPSFLNSDRIYAENRAWRGLDKNFALC